MPRCSTAELRRRAEEALRRRFASSGYIRRPATDSSTTSRNRSEVRLVLHSERELERAQRWLRLVGLRPGKPYRRYQKLVQPVYGTRAVEWFYPAASLRSA